MVTSEAAAAAYWEMGLLLVGVVSSTWVWRHPFIIAHASASKHVRGPYYVIKSRDIADGTPSCRWPRFFHASHRAFLARFPMYAGLKMLVRF